MFKCDEVNHFVESISGKGVCRFPQKKETEENKELNLGGLFL